jgi:hypothetical protein
MKIGPWSVCVCFAIMVLANFLSQNRTFGGKDNKELSDTHPTYLSPDGLTFAIWSLIYLFELILVIVQVIEWSPSSKISVDMVFGRECRLTGLDVRQRLAFAFLSNAAWLPLFTNEYFFASFGVMAAYLGLLVSINLDINASTSGCALARFVFGTGISMNASWVLVAFFISILLCGGEVGWKDEHAVAGGVPVAIGGLMVVTCIAEARAVLECEMAWAFVTAWALRGIYRMQTVVNAERFPPVAMNASLACWAMWAANMVILCMTVGFIRWMVGNQLGCSNSVDLRRGKSVDLERGKLHMYKESFQAFVKSNELACR